MFSSVITASNRSRLLYMLGLKLLPDDRYLWELQILREGILSALLPHLGHSRLFTYRRQEP